MDASARTAFGKGKGRDVVVIQAIDDAMLSCSVILDSFDFNRHGRICRLTNTGAQRELAAMGFPGVLLDPTTGRPFGRRVYLEENYYELSVDPSVVLQLREDALSTRLLRLQESPSKAIFTSSKGA
jgi:hypothetical protein